MPDDYSMPDNSGEGSADQANYLQNAINTSLPLSGYVPKPTVPTNNEFGFDNNPTGVIGTNTPAEIAAAKASYDAANSTNWQDALKNITGFIQQNKGILSAGALASALSGGGGGGGAGNAVGIPSLVANRMQVPGTTDPYRVPGSSGRQYFTDTVYSDPSQQTTAQGLIQAQAQAIAANQPNAPVPSFAMPYNNIRGGITSLPTTQTQTPTTQTQIPAISDLANQLQTAYTAGDIGKVNNLISTSNLDMVGLLKLFPALDTAGMKTLTDAGIKLPPLVNQPPLVPTPTKVDTTKVATPNLTDQLTTAWGGGKKPDVATINKLITDNKLDLAGLQKLFPSIVAGDLQALSTAGVNIPGYTPASTKTPALADQLLASWNSQKPADIANINKLITDNKLDINGLQKLFPTLDAGGFQSLTAAGVKIPGLSAPDKGVSASAADPLLAAYQSGNMDLAKQIISQQNLTPQDIVTKYGLSQADAQTVANNLGYTGGVGSLNYGASSATPAAVAPAAPVSSAPSSAEIASFVSANMGNPAAIAKAMQTYGVTVNQVAAATGYTPAQVAAYVAPAVSGGDVGGGGATGEKTGGMIGYAAGGKAKQPRYLSGDTDGMADEINTTIDDRERAKLSHGEFVIPADVVSHMGNGNSDAGAKKLYDMMAKIRKARTGNPKQGKQINPDKFTGGIAGYAAGGNVKGYAGEAGSQVTSSGTTSGIAGLTNTGGQRSDTLSSYVAPYVTQMLGQGQALANAPMQTYQGPLTAGQSALQNQQFAGLSQMAQTGYNPMDYQSQDFNQEQAQKYMNPYLSASLAPQLSELQRQAQINNTMDASKLTGAGAYGGGRQAVLMGEQNRNLLDKSNQLIGSGYNTAYSNAMSQFNADQARQAAAQQNTEASRQFSANTGIKTLDMLGQAGAAQRDIAQQGISADQAQFKEQQLYPYQQLAFQQSLLGGLPISTAVTTPNAMSDTGNILAALGVVSNPDIAAKLKQLGIG